MTKDKPTCRTCPYWHRWHHLNHMGNCKRFPPQFSADPITLNKVPIAEIWSNGVVTLSFSGRKGQGLVDIQAKQAAIFHASKASRRW